MDEQEYLKNSIKELEKQINTLQNELKQKKARLYELSPKTFKAYISKTTRSIELMDKFEEKTDDGLEKYKRMILGNEIWGKYGIYSLIIERPENAYRYIGSTYGITMTDLKKGNTLDLKKTIENEIEMWLKTNEKKKTAEIIFSEPYPFRAQNSNNRRGYGSFYYEGELLPGTLYGETTQYVIKGVEVQFREFQYS